MSFAERVQTMRRHAVAVFTAGLQAVKPENAIKTHCRRSDNRLTIGEAVYNLSVLKHIYVVGAGKAAAPMAQAIEKLLGDRLAGGIVVTKYGHTLPLQHIHIIEAGHPIPDAAGCEGAAQIMAQVRTARAGDLIIALISGGGSALMALPVRGLTLAHKQAVNQALVVSGATIHEINAVRKHISAIKGGRLAEAAWPAAMATLILSDVVGDDLDVIASGPTVPDSSTFADCLVVIEKYGIREKIPAAVRRYLLDGVKGNAPETPKAASRQFGGIHNLLIGSNANALAAARQQAEQLGYNTLILTSLMQGEARAVAPLYGAIAGEIVRFDRPVGRPACILSGGETTVTVRGNGLGGRNQELALAVAPHIRMAHPVVFLSAGSDGSDGPTNAAGAIADATTLDRAGAAGLDALDYLNRNDAWHFFKPLGDLLITGPTHTNVMDIQVLLVA